MKKYLAILAASVALAGCAHNDVERERTYNQSGTYSGGTGTESSWERGESSDMDREIPSGAERTPGANEHSPPALAPGAYAPQPGF